MDNEKGSGWLSRWARRKAVSQRAPETSEAISQNTAAPPPSAADLAGLDSSSDYARFLAGDVEPGLRVEALRRLWASAPGLAEPDGLIDYSGDYGIAGIAPGDVLATAYRVGTGLLSDEEAAEWAALGQPEPGRTDTV